MFSAEGEGAEVRLFKLRSAAYLGSANDMIVKSGAWNNDEIEI